MEGNMSSTQTGVAQPSGVRSGQPGQRTVRLPYGRDAVPQARERIVADLQARGITRQVVEEAESVVAELVSNAVRHASPLTDGTVRLHWQVRDGVVEIEVSDGGGATRPRAMPPSQLGSSGRGLRIVRSLAHEWGVVPGHPGAPGCMVWASVGGPSRRRAY
jgi:serine/threonine-protein kinase RsbW